MRRMVNSRAVRFLDRRAAEQVVDVDGSTVAARKAVTSAGGPSTRPAAYHAPALEMRTWHGKGGSPPTLGDVTGPGTAGDHEMQPA